MDRGENGNQGGVKSYLETILNSSDASPDASTIVEQQKPAEGQLVVESSERESTADQIEEIKEQLKVAAGQAQKAPQRSKSSVDEDQSSPSAPFSDETIMPKRPSLITRFLIWLLSLFGIKRG